MTTFAPHPASATPSAAPAQIGSLFRGSRTAAPKGFRTRPMGQWASMRPAGLLLYRRFGAASPSRSTRHWCPASPELSLDLLGAVGMTAYFGFLEVCEPKAGRNPCWSAARPGRWAALSGQLAKIHGCRARSGIAGGAAKCARAYPRKNTGSTQPLIIAARMKAALTAARRII